MLRRKILAVVTTLALALGMSVGGAATAFANPNNGSEMNQASYWKNLYPHAVECYKHTASGGEHGGLSGGGVKLNTFKQSWPGDRWEVLIVKGGNGDNFGNAVYEFPTAGTVYKTPTGQAVSHWIVCKGSTPAAASVSVTPETCTSPAKLVLGTTTQARFDAPTYTNVTGGQNYRVVARAIDSATFPIGTPGVNDARTQVVFTGFLPNANPATCATATGDVTVGVATCVAGASPITANSFTGVANATGVVTKDGSQGGTFEVVFTANSGTTFAPSLAGTRDGKTYTLSNGSTKLTVTGTLPGADRTLCADMKLTFMCKTQVEGPVTNLAYANDTTSWPAGVYIMRVTSDRAGVAWTVKDDGGNVIQTGVSTGQPQFFSLSGPKAGMSLFWENLKHSTSSTNDTSLCGFTPKVTDAAIAFTAADCFTGSALDPSKFSFVAEESTYAITDGENGQKVITFTAALGYTFEGGAATKIFTFTPTGPDLTKCVVTTAFIDITPADCLTGSSLNVQGFEYNAEQSSYVITDGENGQKVITFTAKPGFLFEGQKTTKVFTFTPEGPNFRLCATATASLTVPDATCDLGQDWSKVSFALANATAEVTQEPSAENGYEYAVVFTANSGAKFLVDGQYRDSITRTGTIDPLPNRELCDEVTADFTVNGPTCLSGSTLGDLSFSEGVTAGEPQFSDDSTSVSVTFTAQAGYAFAGGEKSLTVTKPLLGPDFTLCAMATASLSVPDATCDLGQDWSEVDFTLANATSEVTQVPAAENGFEYEVVFTANSGAKFFVDGQFRDSITRTGTIDPLPNRELCDEVTADFTVIDPTCATGATLGALSFSEGVTAGEPQFSEDGTSVSVVFTAPTGTIFPNGEKSLTVTKQLAGPDSSLCEEPTLEGSIATTACETDVPYILFSIELNDPDNQSTAGLEDAEIIFSGLDSEGNERELVLDNLEGTVEDGVFSGRVLWPGAAVVDGQAAGWPGWELADGEWTNVGDENFGWTRSLSSVTLSVNPSLVVDLSYPQASPLCASDPTVVDAFVEYSYDCLLGGTIELSDAPGVIWTVDGEQTDQRVFTGLEIDDQPVITASLDPETPGLFFSPESITELTVEFELPEEGCDLVTSPLVTPTLSTTQATCTTAGSYTLNAVEGVQWLVNGQVTAPGTYTATTGSAVEVEAVALQGFGFGFETQTEWTLSFPAPAAGACDLPTLSLEETDLPTLALTGASGMLGTVGIIALLITLTGIGAVVARRRVEA